MTERKRTLKERRADSDERIIASAIKSFGQRGYTYSQIREIASGAGVTSGLITQRYGTKDNLFLVAYETALKDVFSEVEDTASPRECFDTIVRVIQNLCDENPDAFDFCNMLHNATDYPKDILREYQEQMKKTNSYEILKRAQSDGIIPEGNLDLLLAAFGAMVFHHIFLCKRYHLEYRSAESYLEFIGFKDEKIVRKERWNRVLETAIANTFDFLLYVNIPENFAEMLKSSDSFSLYDDFRDARKSIELTIRQIVPEEEQPKMREYLDLDTLSDRMKGRKSLSLKINDTDGKMIVHSFLPLTWDENGELVEVFAGIYRVQANGMPQ